MKTVQFALYGSFMSGFEGNSNITKVGGKLVRKATTDGNYRIWSIDDVHPAMLRVGAGGAEINLEIWEVPVEAVTNILLDEPPGLCIGRISLSDGEQVLGAIAEPYLCEGKQEITKWAGAA